MTGAPASIGVGIVGCGHVTATRHLPALAAVADTRLVAFADRDRDRLAELGELHRDAALYPDVHDLLADQRVDVLAVCVPAASHSEVVIAALDAGVPVLVEKPLALALDDAEEVARHAEHTGTPALAGFNLRWHRLVQRAAEALRAGALGELELLRSMTTSPTLVETETHHYDLWRFLTGAEVEEVSVLSRSRLTDDDVSTISARLSTGALVSAVFREGAGSASGITLFGSDGNMDVSLRELRPGFRARRRRSELLASYRAEWEHFLDAVRTGSPLRCTLDDGVEALRIALAAAESVETGRPVTVAEPPRTIRARVQ
jgi:myo-inositol 2-dehydrogenase / D-chiro-inositol 1-dehydrogenase